MSRICAIDLGTKRIGIAVSDEMKLLAQPLMTLAFKSDQSLIDEIHTLINTKNIETVVIGLPLLPDGKEGAGCLRARSFEKKLRDTGVQTVLFDERYSSEQAEDVLRSFGKNRKHNKEKVDKIAAALILKGYMETLS